MAPNGRSAGAVGLVGELFCCCDRRADVPFSRVIVALGVWQFFIFLVNNEIVATEEEEEDDEDDEESRCHGTDHSAAVTLGGSIN